MLGWLQGPVAGALPLLAADLGRAVQQWAAQQLAVGQQQQQHPRALLLGLRLGPLQLQPVGLLRQLRQPVALLQQLQLPVELLPPLELLRQPVEPVGRQQQQRRRRRLQGPLPVLGWQTVAVQQPAELLLRQQQQRPQRRRLAMKE
jgi:hypothetical protein